MEDIINKQVDAFAKAVIVIKGKFRIEDALGDSLSQKALSCPGIREGYQTLPCYSPGSFLLPTQLITQRLQPPP